MPESIQEWLVGLGFTSQGQEFTKTALLGVITIPHEALRGHNLSSFKRYATKMEWVTPEEVRTGKPEVVSMPAFIGFMLFVYSD